MKPMCEVVVAEVLPSLRALIARELVDSGLNQSDAAKKLGVSQPAISQYLRDIRGSRNPLLEQPVIKKEIQKIANDIKDGKIDTKDLVFRFCELCKLIRNKKMLCPAHKQIYPAMESCDVCPIC